MITLKLEMIEKIFQTNKIIHFKARKMKKLSMTKCIRIFLNQKNSRKRIMIKNKIII